MVSAALFDSGSAPAGEDVMPNPYSGLPLDAQKVIKGGNSSSSASLEAKVVLPGAATTVSALGHQVLQMQPSHAPVAIDPPQVSLGRKYILFPLRVILWALTMIGFLGNLTAVIPVHLLLTILIFSPYWLYQKKFCEKWKHVFPDLLLFFKNAAAKSLGAAQSMKDPNVKTIDWVVDLLNILIDTNGEVRNAFTVASAVASFSPYGFVLGPLRIYQGLLVCILSGIKLLQIAQRLKEKDLNPIERNELELNRKAYIAYEMLGLSWILLGGLQIINASMGSAVPYGLALAYAIVTFITFDIGFFTMSGFYIAQSSFWEKNYIQPAEDIMKKLPEKIANLDSLEKIICEKVFSKETRDLMEQVKSKHTEQQIRKFRCDLLKEIEKKGIEFRNEKDLEQYLQECIDLSMKKDIERLRYLMKRDIDRKKAQHFWLNIILSATTQIVITASGTAWDINAMQNPMSPPDSPLCDATQGVAWINQNTDCKHYDDPGMAEGLTCVDKIKEEKRIHRVLKWYSIIILGLLSVAVLATDGIGMPAAIGLSS